jgi:hypothetical protein
MAVIESCSTVAVATQIRYGSGASATQRYCGQTAKIIQILVPSTIKMSAEASGRFRLPG